MFILIDRLVRRDVARITDQRDANESAVACPNVVLLCDNRLDNAKPQEHREQYPTQGGAI